MKSMSEQAKPILFNCAMMYKKKPSHYCKELTPHSAQTKPKTNDKEIDVFESIRKSLQQIGMKHYHS